MQWSVVWLKSTRSGIVLMALQVLANDIDLHRKLTHWVRIQRKSTTNTLRQGLNKRYRIFCTIFYSLYLRCWNALSDFSPCTLSRYFKTKSLATHAIGCKCKLSNLFLTLFIRDQLKVSASNKDSKFNVLTNKIVFSCVKNHGQFIWRKF